MMNNTKGMTIIEALIGNMLLMIVIFASLSIYKNVISYQNGSENDFLLVMGRNRLLSSIRDVATWKETTIAAENTSVSCILKQDSLATSDRDCQGLAEGKLNLYLIDGSLTAETLNDKFGIDRKGSYCTNYVEAPDIGDPLCLFGVAMRVNAQCPSSGGCFNPLLQVSGKFSYNGAVDKVINLKLYDFAAYLSGIYCPNQTENNNWLSDGSVTVNADKVMAINQASQTGHYAYSQQLIFPCLREDFSFTIDTSKYDYSVNGNNTRLCISDGDTGNCAYTIVQKIMPDNSLGLDFLDSAVTMASKPSWLVLTGNEVLSFQVVNGLVRACVNYQCLYTFEKKLHSPFRILVYPGWASSANQALVSSFVMKLNPL